VFKILKRLFGGSWKTTTAGGAGLGAMWIDAFGQIFDKNDLTNPNWRLIVPTTCVAIGTMLSRDNDKTSEQVGVK
jgi:hypothetical protein